MPRLLRRDIHDACFSFRTFLEISYNCVETVVRCSLVDVRCCGSLTCGVSDFFISNSVSSLYEEDCGKYCWSTSQTGGEHEVSAKLFHTFRV